MPKLTVSPGNHTRSCGREKAFAFHSREGRIPAFSPPMSMPVGLPKPNGPMNVDMRSTPISLARP